MAVRILLWRLADGASMTSFTGGSLLQSCDDMLGGVEEVDGVLLVLDSCHFFSSTLTSDNQNGIIFFILYCFPL